MLNWLISKDCKTGSDAAAMDYESFLSSAGKRVKADGLRQLATLLARSSPDLINLAPGFPDPATFPLTRVTFTLRHGAGVTAEISLDEAELATALQYAPTEGDHELLRLLRQWVTEMFHPPLAASSSTQDPRRLDVIVTNGCTEAMQKTFDVLLNEGDSVLVENPCFSAVLSSLRQRGVRMLGVDTDSAGMVPAALQATLEAASAKSPGRTSPRLLYVVPSGANPSTGTLTAERKRQMYGICQQYNILILEDDPYYFLNYEPPASPTFLSLDVDGRVLRCDSFSKVLAPGLRLGALAGPAALVARVRDAMTYMTTCNGSLAQRLLYHTLSTMGIEGFRDHAHNISAHYKAKRDAMARAADAHLTGLAEWCVPSSGLFFWFRLHSEVDAERLIMDEALDSNVLLVPGSYFLVDEAETPAPPQGAPPCPYVRACFSFSSPQQIEEGMKRFAALVRKKVAVVDAAANE